MIEVSPTNAVRPQEMTSNHPHDWSGCFSGLLAGSRRQRGSHHAPPQGESAPHVPQEPSPEKSIPGEFVGVIYIDVTFKKICALTLRLARICANRQQLRLWQRTAGEWPSPCIFLDY